jgi:hypothetical protein
MKAKWDGNNPKCPLTNKWINKIWCAYHARLFSFKRKKALSGLWWLMPVILATQETKIRKIAVRSQAGQII